jgi:16S rRNA G1207 methylase RsmC
VADFTSTDQAVVVRIADLGCGPGRISFRLA